MFCFIFTLWAFIKYLRNEKLSKSFQQDYTMDFYDSRLFKINFDKVGMSILNRDLLYPFSSSQKTAHKSFISKGEYLSSNISETSAPKSSLWYFKNIHRGIRKTSWQWNSHFWILSGRICIRKGNQDICLKKVHHGNCSGKIIAIGVKIIKKHKILRKVVNDKIDSGLSLKWIYLKIQIGFSKTTECFLIQTIRCRFIITNTRNVQNLTENKYA